MLIVGLFAGATYSTIQAWSVSLENLFSSLRLILGRHAFAWLLTGRYRVPVEEIRVFMFVDLLNSTAIAERLGNVNYHKLVHKMWCDITEPILIARGDIYKFVGDEV